MGIGHIMKLGSKFLLRGVIYKSGKKAAIKGGKVGIGIFSVLYAGYMAYTLYSLRKESIEEQKQLDVDRGWDRETVKDN
ncbi:hypothetical protein [Christiangramia forsetii]|uniref:Uncharacterized protein n=2 Tax=Christiangramia forsetii TaxID=411153 RepID=A0M5S0_CHRFK|nr:hypothetical protein [Christiangramia forsetii]GGG32333.1 hypothetical protein GCM10011532_14780 [Christiangramia forsetii]CAL67965.1 hypothetical protein GFO_3020 [Christiangramia forsetii KT0803]